MGSIRVVPYLRGIDTDRQVQLSLYCWYVVPYLRGIDTIKAITPVTKLIVVPYLRGIDTSTIFTFVTK